MKIINLKASIFLLLFNIIFGQYENDDNLFGLNIKENINECCDLTFKDINELSLKIQPLLKDLMNNEDYFKHLQFKLDMNCPFFECQSICFSPGCQLDLDVHSIDYNYDLLNDDDDNNNNNNNNNLGDLNEDSFLDSLCPPENQLTDSNNNEWCDLNVKNGIIIDISRNPERFTGYLPSPEQNIWSMIYQNQLEGECLIEQKVFYQIISGFHSSVSTHLCNEFFNNVSKSWEPNLELFNFKVGNYPERIQNIYFNYALLIRSIFKLSSYLKNYKFNLKNSIKNKFIHNKINEIINELPNHKFIFNEDLIFKNFDTKEEFRIKFKNVTKLMDCVTCDRCRLWGKIQSTGYATALKILFTDTPNQLNNLSRNEILSLFNTFDRLTKSINSIINFNNLNLLNQLKINNNNNNINNNNKKNFNDYLIEELFAWKQGFKFVFNSYINLPKNIKNLILYKLNQWWNNFIGIKEIDKNIEYTHNIII